MAHNARPELAIVRKIKEILSSPEKWTQGYIAKDTHGKAVSTKDENAVCFCLIGATRKADPDFHYMTAHVFMPVRIEFATRGISTWNDDPERTYEDIEELLKDAKENYIAHCPHRTGSV